MFNIAKWFTGITLAILQLKESFMVIGNDCEIVEARVDCAGKLSGEMVTLTKNLSENVEVLDISSNDFRILTETTFADFANLKELIMADVVIRIKVSNETLDPLTKLETLNISRTVLGTPWAKIPSSITRLIAENFVTEDAPNEKLADVSEIDFTHLLSLEEVFFKSNGLEGFPNISQHAPLTSIDLRKNPMKTLKYIDIAPFCQLKEFKIDSPPTSDENLLVQCCGVKMWLVVHNITSDVSCGAGNCPEQQFEQSANEAYESCEENISAPYGWSIHDLVLNIVISFALVLAIAYLVWRYYKSHVAHHEVVIKKEEKTEFGDEEGAQSEPLPENETSS